MTCSIVVSQEKKSPQRLFFSWHCAWRENQIFCFWQKWFGAVSEVKKCLHVFVNERKSEHANDPAAGAKKYTTESQVLFWRKKSNGFVIYMY